MPIKPKHTLAVLILFVTVFVYGLVQLLSLRFESGDTYPAYSSLRSDPLGTRALFEGLDQLTPAAVQRNYRPLSQLNFEKPTIFLHLGSSRDNAKYIENEFSDAVDRLTTAGGRLVLSYRPVRWMHRKKGSNDESRACRVDDNRPADRASDPEASQGPTGENADEGGTAAKKPQGNPAGDQPDDSSMSNCQTVAIDEHWGVSFKFERPRQKQSYAMVVSGTDSASLPEKISWHTDLVFEKLDDTWQVLYRRDDLPVIVERPFGSGKIILLADSYLLSNEALREERHPALLARIIGSGSQIVFDESHFGIYKVPGIAGLIRTHGLHWFFGGVLLIFLLFVWKNSTHFIPPADDVMEETDGEDRQGRDVFQGLVSLLRRNISPRDILKVGMEEWRKSFDFDQRLRAHQLAQIMGVIDMEQAVSEDEVDPVEGYITISLILSEGKKNE